MRPREFYDYARRTAANGTRAADFRTAISRAYYATYHVAQELVLSAGGSIAERDQHVDLRKHLECTRDDILRAVANDMRTLHNDRKAADYNISDRTLENQTEAMARVEEALMLIEKLEKRFAGPEKGNIKSAIAKWVTANKPTII